MADNLPGAISISGTRDGQMAEIGVGDDTGPGLSEEVHGKLFQPFVRSKPNGMGVGLSVCRTIVEAHGGRIWANAALSGDQVHHSAPGASVRRDGPARAGKASIYVQGNRSPINRRNATLATSSLREASACTQTANSFMVSLRLGEGRGKQILVPLEF